MKKIKFVAFLILASFPLACSQQERATKQGEGKISFGLYDVSEKSTETASVAVSSNNEQSVTPATQASLLNQAEQTQTAPIAVERKIIRNADLQLEANAPEEAQQKITQIAESKGGFVVESTQSSSDVKATTRDTVTMTVRVPSAKFDEALNRNSPDGKPRDCRNRQRSGRNRRIY